MPFSSASGKLYTHVMLQQLNTLGYLDHILDIGVGMGTYKKLMEGKFQTSVEWTGVEAWEPYIEQFGLKNLYDEIIVEDVRKLNLADLSSCDFVLCGDVLEHMTKEEALQIANDCLENFNGMMISIPIIHSPQGAFAGNPYEVHVKDDWSHDEVLESFPDICAYFVEKEIGVYFLSRNAEVANMLGILHNKALAALQSAS